MLRAAALCLAALGAVSHASKTEYHRYLVVGAGPGGLQMGHYLDTAGRDYLILDKNAIPASFFDKYPRFRQLISINKRYSGNNQLDFSMRHDWNSLLSEPSHASDLGIYDAFNRTLVPCLRLNATDGTYTAVLDGSVLCLTADYSSSDAKYTIQSVAKGLQFRDYTRTYYPEADKIVQYMRFYASEEAPRGVVTGPTSRFAGRPKRALNIAYNTRVERVEAHPSWPVPATREPAAEDLTGSSDAGMSGKKDMGAVAGGKDMGTDGGKPKSGMAWSSMSGSGSGVSAASAAAAAAAAADREAELRAIAEGLPRFRVHTNTGVTYECTFLIWAGGLQNINPPEGANIQEALEKGWVKMYSNASTDMDDYEGKNVLVMGRGNAAMEFANHILEVANFVHLIGREKGRIRLSWETHYPGDVRSVHSHILETYLLKSMDALAEVPFNLLKYHRNEVTGRINVTDPLNACERDALNRERDRCFFRQEFDHVIMCPGWQFDTGPFDAAVSPVFFKNNKHPAITPRYESANVRGLYFCGNLMHAHDFKKSSGGFIHGFRYLVRALHRILEEEELLAWNTAVAAGSAPTELAKVDVDTLALSTQKKFIPLPPTRVPDRPHLPVSKGTAWPHRSVSGLRRMAHALLQRINYASALYQMFGGVGDVLVLHPFGAEDAKGFTTSGVVAALEEPWSFYDADAETVYAPQVHPSKAQRSSRGSKAVEAEQAKSDAVINSALSGWLYEEIPVKLAKDRATAWHKQMLAEKYGTSLPPSTATVGVEYMVLTLEFGTGSSSHVPEEKKNLAMEDNPDAFIKAQSEWTRDPFSLLRANVSLWNPETSHFLHPVLRYYHTGLDGGAASVAECHIIEDFHIKWNHHLSHVLTLTRFLQDVGARRARVAQLLGASNLARTLLPKNGILSGNPAGSAGKDKDVLAASSSGHVSGPLAKEARETIQRVMTVDRRADTHTEMVRQLMQPPHSTMWMGGKSVKGGEGWFNALTINATDWLLYKGPRMIMTHWIDTYPFPPTEEEEELYQNLRSVMTNALTEPGAVMKNQLEYRKPLNATPAQLAQKADTEKFLANFYSDLTAQTPGLVIISVMARGSFERVQAEKFGVDSLPLWKTIDLYRGVMNLPGNDFDGATPERLKYLYDTYSTARAAFLRGDESLMFPGYTRAMLMGSAPEMAGAGPQGMPPPDEDIMMRQYEEQNGAPMSGGRRGGGGGGGRGRGGEGAGAGPGPAAGAHAHAQPARRQQAASFNLDDEYADEGYYDDEYDMGGRQPPPRGGSGGGGATGGRYAATMPASPGAGAAGGAGTGGGGSPGGTGAYLSPQQRARAEAMYAAASRGGQQGQQQQAPPPRQRRPPQMESAHMGDEDAYADEYQGAPPPQQRAPGGRAPARGPPPAPARGGAGSRGAPAGAGGGFAGQEEEDDSFFSVEAGGRARAAAGGAANRYSRGR